MYNFYINHSRVSCVVNIFVISLLLLSVFETCIDL